MAKPSRDTGLSLLQQSPSRELLLEKMRSKLASTPSAAATVAVRRAEIRKSVTATWSMRALMLLGFIAINYFIIGHRGTLAAKIGIKSVPSLPTPSAYTTDEQALYYVYALYDYPMLEQRFGASQFFAIDQAETRRKLDALLPEVSPETLGAISRYMPVAFKSVQLGANP